MKFALKCSLASLAGVVIAAVLLAQSVDTFSLPLPVVNMPGDTHAIVLKGRYAGGWHEWLVVESHNADEWKTDGYHPSYTRLTADYKPVIRKLRGGKYEIQFVSEIAENLP